MNDELRSLDREIRSTAIGCSLAALAVIIVAGAVIGLFVRIVRVVAGL